MRSSVLFPILLSHILAVLGRKTESRRYPSRAGYKSQKNSLLLLRYSSCDLRAVLLRPLKGSPNDIANFQTKNWTHPDMRRRGVKMYSLAECK